MTEQQVNTSEGRLLEFWRARPFHPFRLRLNDGITVVIEHPQEIAMAPAGIYLLAVALDDGTVQIMDTRDVLSVKSGNGDAEKS